MKPFAIKLLCIIALLSVAGCAPKEDPDATDDETEEVQRAVVEAVTLQATDFIEMLSLTGTTEPIRAATIASEVGGRIVRLNLDEGSTVEEGDTLVRVDASQQSAQAAQLRAQREQFDSDIARTERLLERGLGTESDLEQLRSQRESVNQQLRGVYIGVGNATTDAPFTGQIVSKSAELGEFTSSGTTLGRMIDISSIKVLVDLPEREIGVVSEGQDATVEIPSLNQTFEGTIHRISAEADARSRTFQVEVVIENADGRLRSGMRARVSIQKNHLENVVVAPLDSLMQGIDGSEAVVVHEGKARVIVAQVGPTRGSYGVITHGLAPGDQLIIHGQTDLVNDEPVETVLIGECCKSQIESYGVATRAPDADSDTVESDEQ